MDASIERALTASRLRLRMKSPFFATLALFAAYVVSDEVETAGTDGKDILINPTYLTQLKPAQLDGLLVHELLHAALLHPLRKGSRNGTLWNIAADIVVNGMIYQHGGFELPDGGIRRAQYEHLSVEEVYAVLMQKMEDRLALKVPDLLYPRATEGGLDRRMADLEAHWNHALQEANLVAVMAQGQNPLGQLREVKARKDPQLDWKTQLWRFLVRTPSDFQGFDRRFVQHRLYLETLAGESVRVLIVADTSGSITDEALTQFLAEVEGVLSAYPHIETDLYFIDAALYGPFPLVRHPSFPIPKGAGGTSFIPFFEHLKTLDEAGQQQAVVVVLTDGHGHFPNETPALPVLWVVAAGGLASEKFPFGEVVRLV